MNKIDLSNIVVKTTNTRCKNIQYSWKDSIGATIPFEYDGIIGEFIVTDYLKDRSGYIKIKYKDKEYEIFTNYLKNLKLRPILENDNEWLELNYWKYHIDEIIEYNNSKIQIINRKIDFRNNYPTIRLRYYQYKCLNCGYSCDMDDYWILEYDLSRLNFTCRCCNNKVVIKGINDINTTHPEYMKYLVDKEFGYTHSYGTKTLTQLKCPECGYIKTGSLIKTITRNYFCPMCSDGVSFPEKVMLNILNELHVNYKYQLTCSDFEWINNYRYDFYLYDYDTIIEINGLQHYVEYTQFGVLNQIDVDMQKEILAKQHVLNYIVIDCRYSDINFIKDNIENSNLPNIINLDTINWNEINKNSSKSLIPEVCKDFNKNYPNISLLQLAKKYNLNAVTIGEYLKKGNELHLCDYNPKEMYKIFATNQRSSPFMIKSENDEKYYFSSRSVFEKEAKSLFGNKFSPTSMRKAIYQSKPYHNFIGKNITKDEFNKIYDQHIDNVFGERFIIEILDNCKTNTTYNQENNIEP